MIIINVPNTATMPLQHSALEPAGLEWLPLDEPIFDCDTRLVDVFRINPLNSVVQQPEVHQHVELSEEGMSDLNRLMLALDRIIAEFEP